MTIQQIESMNYTDFIAYIKETNRCPGGKNTVRTIAQNTFIDRNSKVLEIGSNTGFTSLELAHLVRCKVYGIDISKSCIDEANNQLTLDTDEIQSLVSFQLGSAYEIPFPDNEFDLVVAGGATSFIEDKQKAIHEYFRVIKPWGFLSVTQLFYIKRPPQQLVDNISEAIGVRVNPWLEDDWKSIFESSSNNFELYFYEKNSLQHRTSDDIAAYIEYFITKDHISPESDEIKQAIRSKWRNYIEIFNENHKYLGFFTALFRKPLYPEEPELFITK